ncbi:putative phage repressor [Thioalkalivibrio nitratireducens DSM 14787]|uniref:Phage repressor n=1 Tax=Thioalkalivibrio nitratireducens (strain DSM 14787 / UNIQEM 213 / ALEN2) TaxID=1255043 RepID=L0DZ75_THIND|nr:S24 family peptidase [Thioalkalivibrio nitratireducens]AGA34353.1 putative phage repressor [Thioalkalivibrio nitratireducens DSM 14787]
MSPEMDLDLSGGGGCSDSEPFALRVLGDSMAPEFEHGMVILIDPSAAATHGSYVVAQVDGEYLFRQLVIEDGGYFLVALKEDHRRLAIPGREAIVGVVTQRAGTRRSQHKRYA